MALEAVAAKFVRLGARLRRLKEAEAIRRTVRPASLAGRPCRPAPAAFLEAVAQAALPAVLAAAANEVRVETPLAAIPFPAVQVVRQVAGLIACLRLGRDTKLPAPYRPQTFLVRVRPIKLPILEHNASKRPSQVKVPTLRPGIPYRPYRHEARPKRHTFSPLATPAPSESVGLRLGLLRVAAVVGRLRPELADIVAPSLA